MDQFVSKLTIDKEHAVVDKCLILTNHLYNYSAKDMPQCFCEVDFATLTVTISCLCVYLCVYACVCLCVCLLVQ